MKANEFGVKAPKANTTRLMSLRQVENSHRVFVLPTAGQVVISQPPLISVARNETVVLERISVDYGGRSLVSQGLDMYFGISKWSGDMQGVLDELVNTAAWLGWHHFAYHIGTSDPNTWVRMDDHSEEDLFETISKESTQDNWDGFFVWMMAGRDDASGKVMSRTEYTRIWMQRTFNTSYTRKGIAYNSGWQDCEWEESFCESDT